MLGQELISYAKHLGIKTINIVRRKEAVNELKLKGYAHCKRPFLLATLHYTKHRHQSFPGRSMHMHVLHAMFVTAPRQRSLLSKG